MVFKVELDMFLTLIQILKALLSRLILQVGLIGCEGLPAAFLVTSKDYGTFDKWAWQASGFQVDRLHLRF